MEQLLSERLPANSPFFDVLDLAPATMSKKIATEAAEPGSADFIGRYRVEHLLGEGGFGRVLRAWDTELCRWVAIKVPKNHRLQRPDEAERFLAEARRVASLDHPHIVPVYDFGRTENGSCYVISKFVTGSDLASSMRQRAWSYAETAVLIATVADALQHAHDRGIVHRDIKPSNIVLDEFQRPHVVDFGLALDEDDAEHGRFEAGTPAYMSPEQARGEGHLIDGRSDQFSLGIVLYELITGSRPFQGDDTRELLDQIKMGDIRPPSERNVAVPGELERICLKALAKRATDRYPSVAELADELRHFSTAAPTPLRAASASRVVPKGLRSFDASDSPFFLELLAGARDRDGLPESLRFWQTKIEQRGANQPLRIGLVYGPSGCGKSSLVRAGLLPRLSRQIVPVLIDATAEDTGERLLNGIHRALRDVPSALALSREFDLPQTVAALRRGRGMPTGRKILLVLDQFEQWLHGRHASKGTQLVEALRQCDGDRVQALLLVRDDFWGPVSRLMEEIEIPIVVGENARFVDLFDPLHAWKVLAEFGKAYGRLPENLGTLRPDEASFLDEAVAGLTEDGKVVCVRLALLADMMKGRPWTIEALRAVGGATGLGETFLEETFHTQFAPASHRRHEQAACAVLQSLLPDADATIKGHMRSARELSAASGYSPNSPEFNELLRLLDGELRLITPAETVAPTAPQTGENSRSSSSAGLPCHYQLTHDFLVPSLRSWLSRRQKQTRRGRAELRLAERSAFWNHWSHRRNLPAAWETLNIWLLTTRNKWTESQRTMMRHALRFHLTRVGVLFLLTMILLAVGIKLEHASTERQRRARAESLVDMLASADTRQTPHIIKQLRDYSQWAEPLLALRLRAADEASPARLHFALALAGSDDRHVDYLYQQLLDADGDRFPVIRDVLAPYRAQLTDRLWVVLRDDGEDPRHRRLRAAAALAEYDPDEAAWAEVAPAVAAQLADVNPLFFSQWRDALSPVADQLVAPLLRIFADQTQSERSRLFATSLLAEYARNDPHAMTEMVLEADAKTFVESFPLLRYQGAAAVDRLQATLKHRPEPTWSDPVLNPAWSEATDAARFAVETAHGIVAERFAFCQDLPWNEFQRVAADLGRCGYRPVRVRPFARRVDARDTSGDKTALTEATGVGNASLSIHVAAVWKRDGRRWAVQASLAPEQLPSPGGPTDFNGLLPADIAPLPIIAPSAERRFILLWTEPDVANEQRRMLVDMDEAQLVAAQSKFVKQGFPAQSTISAWTDDAGRRRYAGIWSNHGAQSELQPAYEGFELVDQPQWDVAVAAATKPVSSDQPMIAESSRPSEQEETRNPPGRYAAIWRADVEFESRLLEPQSIQSLLESSRELAAQGYRPVAIAVDDGESPHATSVWHRPEVPGSVKEHLAERQANAAVALLRMQGENSLPSSPAEPVWELLQHREEPRLRSHLLHRLVAFGVDPGLIIERLQIETQPSRRRALLLAIGDFARAKLLTTVQREAAVTTLAGWYSADPDSGIHGATEWSLRQLGADAKIEEIRKQFATGEVVDDRRWFVTRQDRLTLTLVRPEAEFLMGSPVTDPDRFNGPTGNYETRHRRRIGRAFAIGTHEVTVEQFERFRPDHEFDRRWARETDAPANNITWYEAAAFCNWLSEREGIPRDQWCYDPDETFADAMGLYPDYLSRTGYRLPTEAEWEYACRAGATTAFAFGDSNKCLVDYAWCVENSQERWLLPVGRMKPNDLGLFDMHGNILERCQDASNRYRKDRPIVDDAEQSGPVRDTQNRIFRGGSFAIADKGLRSSYRIMLAPISQYYDQGFRVARTLPARTMPARTLPVTK